MNFLVALSTIIKERDEKLIEKYCQKGSYMGTNAKVITGVCRQVVFDDLLNTIHNNDVVFIEMVKARIELEQSRYNDPKVRTALNNLLAYLSK